MGLAASQARYLQLTARKSNIEYQGQQLNQARTALADQSAQLFNEMLEIEPPAAPTSSSSEFTKPTYSFTDANDTRISKTIKNWSPSIDPTTGEEMEGYHDLTIQYQNATGTEVTNQYQRVAMTFNDNGQLTSIQIPNEGFVGYDPTTGAYADSTT